MGNRRTYKTGLAGEQLGKMQEKPIQREKVRREERQVEKTGEVTADGNRKVNAIGKRIITLPIG